MTEVIDQEFSGEYKSLESIKSRAKFAMISLGATMILQVMTAFLQRDFIQQFKNGASVLKYEYLMSQNEPLKLVTNLGTVASILAVVSICMWFFSANKNLHTAGLPMVEFTPSWAVGWFFIPIAFFYYPFAVLNEIYKGTIALTKPKSDNWKSESSDPTILLWWIIYWIPMVVVLSMIKISLDPYVMFQNAIDLSEIAIYTTIATVVSGILLFRLIYKISSIQESLVQR